MQAVIENPCDISQALFLFKSYIQRHIHGVKPKYTYCEESGVNPAFQRIEEVDRKLRLNEKRIFVLRSDFILATGVKNAEQHLGYEGLKETFDESQYAYLNWNDRYGHPSLAIPDQNYDGSVLYAGFVCQREKYLEVFLSSGRYNRCNRINEGVLPLTTEETHVIESYLSLKFRQAYGFQTILFFDTTPEKDEVDSRLFFTNSAFREKNPRCYTATTLNQAFDLVQNALNYAAVQTHIQNTISVVNPKYSYPGEAALNPGYQDIVDVAQPLLLHEKRIWVLRKDFILAIGVKNAYEKEYGYAGFKESFSPTLYSFINWDDRYGHPSLAIPESDYDGSVFYAGYLCQRKGYLQVYLVSGRFERTDLNKEQKCLLEAYIAAQFQTAYGNQEIIFDEGCSDIPSYHMTFFKGGTFEQSNPQRRYTQSSIQAILQNTDIIAEETATRPKTGCN